MVQSLLFVLFPPRPRAVNVATAFPNSWNVSLYTPKVVNLRHCDLSRRDHDANMLDKKGVPPPLPTVQVQTIQLLHNKTTN